MDILSFLVIVYSHAYQVLHHGAHARNHEVGAGVCWVDPGDLCFHAPQVLPRDCYCHAHHVLLQDFRFHHLTFILFYLLLLLVFVCFCCVCLFVFAFACDYHSHWASSPPWWRLSTGFVLWLPAIRSSVLTARSLCLFCVRHLARSCWIVCLVTARCDLSRRGLFLLSQVPAVAEPSLQSHARPSLRQREHPAGPWEDWGHPGAYQCCEWAPRRSFPCASVTLYFVRLSFSGVCLNYWFVQLQQTNKGLMMPDGRTSVDFSREKIRHMYNKGIANGHYQLACA